MKKMALSIQEQISINGFQGLGFHATICNQGIRLTPASIAYSVFSQLFMDREFVEDMILFESQNTNNDTVWDIVFTIKPHHTYSQSIVSRIQKLQNIKVFKIKNMTNLKRLASTAICVHTCQMTGKLIENLMSSMKETTFEQQTLPASFADGTIGWNPISYFNRKEGKVMLPWQSALDAAVIIHSQVQRTTKASNIFLYGKARNKVWAVNDLMGEIPFEFGFRADYITAELTQRDRCHLMDRVLVFINSDGWIFNSPKTMTALKNMLMHNVLDSVDKPLFWTGMLVIIDEREDIQEIIKSLGWMSEYFTFVNADQDAVDERRVRAVEYVKETIGESTGLVTVSAFR